MTAMSEFLTSSGVTTWVQRARRRGDLGVPARRLRVTAREFERGLLDDMAELVDSPLAMFLTQDPVPTLAPIRRATG
jgi:hypothetical protein